MRMFELLKVVQGVSIKGPMEIEQFSRLISIRLILDNLIIK